MYYCLIQWRYTYFSSQSVPFFIMFISYFGSYFVWIRTTDFLILNSELNYLMNSLKCSIWFKLYLLPFIISILRILISCSLHLLLIIQVYFSSQHIEPM